MSNNKQTTRHTILLEGGKPWGFRIVGGTDMNVPLQIQQVLSAKAKDSGIQKEDRIFEINGKDTNSMSHNDAKNLIIESGNTLKLVVERTSKNDSQSNLGMSSAPSKSSASSEPFNGITTKTSNETPQKVEIRPKVSLSDEKLSEGKLEQKSNQKQEETSTQLGQNKTLISEDIGPIISSEIKSPFLKNLITSGVDQPTNQNLVRVQPPTSTYSPYKAVPEKSNATTSSSAKTNNNISSKTMNDNEDKLCAGCHEIIKDSSYISASDKYYHKPHFCCSHCGNTLVGKAYFEDKDNKVCCQLCISKGGGDICKICNKPIHGSFLTVGKDCYHDTCFVCPGCNKNLKSESFIFADGKPKCGPCYEDSNSTYCIKCKKPIKAGESFVEVENGNCHSKCFTCKICKSILTSFKMRDGYAICPKH